MSKSAELRGIVQRVVRSVKCVEWTPGWSRCFKDTSYTHTKKTVRYNFDSVKVSGGKCSYKRIAKAERAVKSALTRAKLPYSEVIAYGNFVYVYQTTPITIIEG